MAKDAVAPEAMERYPRTMLDELMQLPLLHGLPERVHPGSTAARNSPPSRGAW
jgi:hypothetical protein